MNDARLTLSGDALKDFLKLNAYVLNDILSVGVEHLVSLITIMRGDNGRTKRIVAIGSIDEEFHTDKNEEVFIKVKPQSILRGSYR